MLWLPDAGLFSAQLLYGSWSLCCQTEPWCLDGVKNDKGKVGEQK